MKKIKPKIFSFFSGAGFLDLGFEHAGFETVFANELIPEFMRTYKYARNKMGIKTPECGCFVNSIDKFYEPELKKQFTALYNKARYQSELVGFIGGPPCPDFSVAGKNKGREGDNGRLSGLYVQMIIDYKPDFFLFENVKGLWRTAKHREYYEELKSKLQKAGYAVTERLINAVEYGVPQDRDRIILIGALKKLSKSKFYDINGYIKDEWFDWNAGIVHQKAEVFGHPFPMEDEFIEDSVSACPNAILKELTVQYWFEKNDVEKHPNAEHYFTPRAGLARFLVVKEGDCSRKSYKRLHRWRYAPTASFGNNEVHLHPFKARRMSVAEALSIQSLPKNYEMPQDASLTNMFKMVGNGVPYLAGKGIGKSLKLFLEGIYETDSIRSDSKNLQTA